MPSDLPRLGSPTVTLSMAAALTVVAGSFAVDIRDCPGQSFDLVPDLPHRPILYIFRCDTVIKGLQL